MPLRTAARELRDEQEPPPVEAVGGEARPRSEEEHGANCGTFRTPSRNGECVSRKTSSEAARFWNQVPLDESAFPAK